MRKPIITIILIIAFSFLGCAKNGGIHSAEETADKTADEFMYKPVEYANKNKQGPALIVIPGKIKSNNASFTQIIKPNNIADFAELELDKANFRVYERSDLGPMLNEISLAVNLGDPRKVRKILNRGKFKTTKWFVKFDVLKAEKVAEANDRFSIPVDSVLNSFGYRGPDNLSLGTKQTAGVWIVGMRYKVLNANTTEQVAQGYFEEKMKTVQNASSIVIAETGQTSQMNLDTMVQRLVQIAVADLDKKK